MGDREKVFELLAPAGTFEILQAVIAAGADAVYVGGQQFGARAYAGNLSGEELLRAIDYAHLHGRRVYLTVNTLLKNTELFGRLPEYLLPLYEQGLDAVLVQDLGALSLIRERFPELPVHASTQMTVTGAEGARLLQELGVSRIVAARELSIGEMAHIHDETGVELETFVHGALCYSYSGQCLFSSMLGGRSGNRGRCAQPCRLPYAVLDQNRRECLSDSYVLSLKDLCGIEDLNRLYAAGVYSLKIEGRMKQLPYAAGVVACYRKYIDRFAAQRDKSENPAVDEADLQTLRELGCRSGFTDCYYSRHNGRSMVTFAKPGYERQSGALQEKPVPAAPQPLKRKASGRLVLRVGEAAQYEVRCGESAACVHGMTVADAQKKPLVRAEVEERMRRTGESAFVMDEVAVELDGDVFLPNGELNRLRRDALCALQDAMLERFRRQALEAGEPKPKAKQESEMPGRIRRQAPNIVGQEAEREPPVPAADGCGWHTGCLIGRRELLTVVLAHEIVDLVYLDAAAYSWESADAFLAALSQDVCMCREHGREAWLALPRIFRRRTAERWGGIQRELRELPFGGVLVRNYEGLEFVRAVLPEFRIAADYSLYTFNDRAVREFARLGACNTVPLELNRKEIAHRDNRCSEMVVYGRSPLMVSAQCVRHNVSRGSLTCGGGMSGRGQEGGRGLCYLRDRYRTEFPVANDCCDCCSVIYNSLPTLLFAKLPELERAGIRRFRLEFTTESKAQAERVLALYEDFAKGRALEYPEEWKNRYTNGHYQRGVE